MITAHKIALDPNNVQATYFAKAAGTARFAYNWALAEWNRQYEARKLDPTLAAPSEGALRRQLNAIKRDRFPWMTEVTKNAPQMAIRHLGVAFRNYFRDLKKPKAQRQFHYPTFHKKGIRDRFTITNDQFEVKADRIRLPILGWVRMRESLRFSGTILSATVTRVADRWFVSIAIDTPDALPQAKNHGAVGVDLGVTTLATLSTQEKFVGPKAHKTLLGRLRRLSRSLSRKVKGSANRKKARTKVARLHARIANIRADAMHKLTTDLTRRFELIGIEDLNVSAMLANRRLSRAVSDMGFFEFRRQLEYKAQRRGASVFVADRWYPSSKICSCCRHKNDEVVLGVAKWACPVCGVIHDRDTNAAINLKILAESSSVSACRELVQSGRSVKQESGVKSTYA